MSDNLQQQNIKSKKSPIKKILAALVVIGVIAAIAGGGGKQANETSKSVTGGSEGKARLTLDDGWTIDKSNPFAVYIHGYVSNNSDKAINTYVQITFNSLDKNGANLGTCIDNTNTIDANGKWKFKAMCLDSNSEIETVRFKEITGF